MAKIYADISITSKKINLQELSELTGLSSTGGHNMTVMSLYVLL